MAWAEKGRYLTLDGYEIPEYKESTNIVGVLKSTPSSLKTPEILAALVITGAVALLYPSKAQSAAFFTAIILPFSNLVFSRVLAEYGLSKSDKVFDKNPNHNERTSPDDEMKARKFSKIFGIAAIGVSIGTFDDFINVINHGAQGAVALHTSAVISALFAGAAYRFGQVAKGKWAITNDLPDQKDPLPDYSKFPYDVEAESKRVHLVPA